MADPRGAPNQGAPGSQSTHGNQSGSNSEMQSLSTTPTQSQMTMTMHGPKEGSQSTINATGRESVSSFGSRGKLPTQPVQQTNSRKTSLSAPRDASANMLYAPSEGESASNISASDFSSGEEDDGRSSVAGAGRSGTLRGRAAPIDRSASLTQSSNIGKAAVGAPASSSGPMSQNSMQGGKRRPSNATRALTGQSDRERSKVRRSSVAPSRERDDYGDNDYDDDGRYGPLDDEDDEVHPPDRGEELVRRRMKARAREKAARRKAEKEKERQQQQQGVTRRQSSMPLSGQVPLSPRPQSVNRQSMMSPSPLLDREGRPTHITLPTPDLAGPAPTLSPLLPVSPGAKGGFHYPSPHSHIRRPSGRPTQESTLGGLNRRVSTMSGSAGQPSRSQTATGTGPHAAQGHDVFSEAATSEAATNSGFRESSSVAAPDDEGDEGRDTVAGLATEQALRNDASLLDAVQGDPDGAGEDEDGGEDEDLSPSLSGEGVSDEDVEYTLKDRQDAINIEHPFGLPIWKPALYKKSRTVTRNAESALHSIPSAAAERHLLPGNLLWTIFAGFWLSVVCFVGAIFINFVPFGGSRYARVVWELGGYLFWPFGKYVEVEVGPESGHRDLANPTAMADGDVTMADGQSYENAFTPVAARFPHDHQHTIPFNSRNRDSLDLSRHDTIRPEDALEQQRSSGSSSSPDDQLTARADDTATESTPLRGKTKRYGATDNLEDGKSPLSTAQRIDEELNIYEYVHDEDGKDVGRWSRMLGTAVYGLLFWLLIAPLMGLVCLACWGTVFPIPMAKLTWVLLKSLAFKPLALHFRSASVMNASQEAARDGDADRELNGKRSQGLLRLKPGQFAPRSTQPSTDGHLYRRTRILLCTYRAMGVQYYKYTVGGVNILFINTLPFVFFTIFDFFFVEPYVHKHHIKHGFLPAISSQGTMFVFALGSVIPLSYFIGMAVASISAQSSIGMGAVINATFGSIIEIILYAIALTQHKARLVEGSIVGSILAGVLLMPGISMCSGATRRKEQRFNAKSAGVTSSMLIMAIIGILTPTLFYQIYGTFQLTCQGCPDRSMPGESWTCKRCFYEHVPPATDPFYQENVKGLMYTCTIILVLSYGIGLWFSLRTHASQIWQNPQPVAPTAPQPSTMAQMGLVSMASSNPLGNIPPSSRQSIYKRLLPTSVVQQLLPTSHVRHQSNTLRSNKSSTTALDRESGNPPPLQLPDGMSQEEYERALTLTASAFQQALHQQQARIAPPPQHARDNHGSQQTARNSAMTHDPSAPAAAHHDVAAQATAHTQGEDSGGHGGHDAPSWTRATSLIVLISCTVLYAIIAEILVDAVDVVLEGSGLDLKLLGVTLFALVPNATEFMNAMSFAINGNIALSMEIGSAYALQVCLIQIPAMVAFSAFYNSNRTTTVHDSFTLIFPRWDVIAIIFAIFLLTYTYIEARSNYFRGSLCILSYVVLVSGFVFAPNAGDSENPGEDGEDLTGRLTSWMVSNGAFGAPPITGTYPPTTSFGGLRESMLAHPAMVGFAWLQAIATSIWYR